MTSELISNLISAKQNSTNPQPSEDSTEKNQNIFFPKQNLNINAEKFIPNKEKIKSNTLPENQPNSTENNNSSISPSFSDYINPQRLLPYDHMLKKNIRTFNLLQNLEKKEETKLENSLKEKYNLDTPTIEINFKFTCDYELIENEIKEFLELFGEINSLEYDMNINSAKINYKYYFSAMYANYYLNHLLNDKNNKNETKKVNDNIIINNENNINKNENYKNEEKPIVSEEKQNEDIVKFIKFLTDNYKNEPKNKVSENERKSSGEKTIKQIALSEDNKISDKNDNNINNNMNYFSLKKNNNSAKNLFLQQNSETPIKKTNTITTYSANNRNPNINNTNSNSENQTPKFNTFAPSTHINPSLRTPMLYVPFVPKMNMGIPISIPVLFPLNSPFLNKSFYLNNNANINNENNTNESKKETKINSCLVDNPTNNPINTNNNEVKNENINSQTQNDNHIKEIFDNLNNKIAIISNNSNNSTNSNEKNMKNAEINTGSDQKSNSEIGSNNKILSNKSDSTIKTEEVNKSNNTKSENSSDKDINSNMNINNEVMSSFNGKTLSLEKLNNFLQDNKPITNFNNPKLSLSSQNKDNFLGPEKNDNSNSNSKQNDFSKDINKQNNNPKISNFDNNNNQKNKKNLFPLPLNNIFNSMFNFLFLQNPQKIPKSKMPQIPQKMNIPLPNPNLFKLKPNPINFNKNVIDFNKLTLETKNKVHFNTHSSRNYYYKYVCNYVVQIENDNLFMVTKRIIGKNGCFLKKILQESCIKYGDYSTKIRLRGKGSGYIDKVNNSENDEPLILSVSSLNYPTYFNCCLLVDNLMNKIYDDYYLHLKNILPKDLHYSIHKKKLIKNEFIVDRVNSMTSHCENKNNINVNNNNLNLTEDKKEENNVCDDKNKDNNENENENVNV